MCQEVGASLAVTLFPAVGPIGMVALRLVFSAIVLLALVRPGLRGRTPIAWRTVAGFGLVLGGMNVFFYLSLERLPLGAAVTIEILGPLTLSVLAGRRWLSALWAGIALVGVLLLGGGLADLDPLGVVFAVAAAALWAGYILFSQSTGRHFAGVSGLALATALAALITAPIALVVVERTALFDPRILVAGFAIAVLSSTIPYALELTALRRMSASAFAILLALAPAIAAGAGFVLLGQTLSPLSLIGIVCVVVASAGAVRTGARVPRPALPPPIS
ncbi:EamA family transporter [Microbacterium radiodurans]|uniref:EamA family transporter n=2 Tax=Microbacterium radiodurans TaxID=661398 RepID=A0A5J5IP48_9MICO|nr:EamA family transporter [Microbacterium radiodurans]